MNGGTATSCYRCEQPSEAMCTMCKRGFCKRHGDVTLVLCREHTRLMVGFAVVVCLALMVFCWFIFWRHVI